MLLRRGRSGQSSDTRRGTSLDLIVRRRPSARTSPSRSPPETRCVLFSFHSLPFISISYDRFLYHQHQEQEPAPEDNVKARLKTGAGGGKVSCRLCKGDHFTAKCPHKNVLAGLEPGALGVDDDLGQEPSAPAPAGGATGGKYVPPSMRGGARGPGERMAGAGGGGASRDDLPTLRVTNISEDTGENDLREVRCLRGVGGRNGMLIVNQALWCVRPCCSCLCRTRSRDGCWKGLCVRQLRRSGSCAEGVGEGERKGLRQPDFECTVES